LGRELIRNYGSYALGSFIEARESKSGFDPLCFVVLFALKMKFLDWLDGTFENCTTNETADCRWYDARVGGPKTLKKLHF
jgi:hypothetical protein